MAASTSPPTPAPSTTTATTTPITTTPSNGNGAPVAAAAFEFTRRKRWADLLITELSDAIVLVLSPAAKVLFCSHAVQELLGWREDELVDHDLCDWVHAADQASLRAALAQRQHANVGGSGEQMVYARLRCKPDAFAPPSSAVLFEISARPHTIPGEHAPRCIFAVAKPCPSRTTHMLNTFLELKIENARLQDRLHALRTRAQTASAFVPPTAAPALQLAVDAHDPQAYYAALGAPPLAAPGYARGVGTPGAGLGQGPSADEGNEDRRKKRKVSVPEQYVCNTCGRTDSPEWRKGPRGPKTLCNACGLRWAKKVRKHEDEGEGAQKPLDDIVPP